MAIERRKAMSRKDDDLEYQEDFEDEVWDEEQWEIFMEEADS